MAGLNFLVTPLGESENQRLLGWRRLIHYGSHTGFNVRPDLRRHPHRRFFAANHEF